LLHAHALFLDKEHAHKMVLQANCPPGCQAPLLLDSQCTIGQQDSSSPRKDTFTLLTQPVMDVLMVQVLQLETAQPGLRGAPKACRML
jgi:hypothetical protein